MKTSVTNVVSNKNYYLPDEALENLNMLELQEQRRKQLEHELEVNNMQINKQRLMIRNFEKEKDR